ncbi:MAG: YjbQ family protein [Nanoarchaeota archaeon]|nr:YjbQ family protein [Nanoarchaeota archaeon]
MKEIKVSTKGKFDIINLTDLVEREIRDVKEGVALVFLPHATSALILNEDEEGLREDILNKLRELVPEKGDYLHNRIDDNAHAHILSSLLKQFVLLPVKDGRLVRGTWQELLLLEFDGPRERRVLMEILRSS